MDLDYIESLAELLAGSQVTELTVRHGERGITLRRRPGATPAEQAVVALLAPPADTERSTDVRPAELAEPLSLPAVALTPTAVVPAEMMLENGTPEYEIVRAHRVGVFWRGTAADGEALVRIGDWAPAHAQLGCIESMRLYDEVDSPQAGVVVGVFVTAGCPVEYGQPLFHLEKRDRPPDLAPNGES